MLEGAKSIGAGAATIASAGAAVGIGNVLSSSIHSVARNPSLSMLLTLGLVLLLSLWMERNKLSSRTKSLAVGSSSAAANSSDDDDEYERRKKKELEERRFFQFYAHIMDWFQSLLTFNGKKPSHGKLRRIVDLLSGQRKETEVLEQILTSLKSEGANSPYAQRGLDILDKILKNKIKDRDLDSFFDE